MKTWKATGCVLMAGIFWGSMGLFVRQLNAAGLYAIDVMQLRVLPSAIFVGLYTDSSQPHWLLARLPDGTSVKA